MPDEIFWEIHSDLPREGPGDNASTRRAYELVTGLPPAPRILDVACGPGMQTMELARLSSGPITAVDMHQPFLDELNRRAQIAGVADRIKTQQGSMMAMPFANGGFDLIWCEGAMYIMGVTEALSNWSRFLIPEGHVAFTEPCFLTDDVPDAVRKLWIEDYAGMTEIPVTVRKIAEAGFSLVSYFTIPDSAWWDDYYTPQEGRLQMLREKYADDPKVLARIEKTQEEINLHRVYFPFYGYVFFVVRRID